MQLLNPQCIAFIARGYVENLETNDRFAICAHATRLELIWLIGLVIGEIAHQFHC